MKELLYWDKFMETYYHWGTFHAYRISRILTNN